MSVAISVSTLPHFGDLPHPAFESPGAAGMDIAAATLSDIVIAPGARCAVPSGLAMAVPAGYEVCRSDHVRALPCGTGSQLPTPPGQSTVTFVARSR